MARLLPIPPKTSSLRLITVLAVVFPSALTVKAQTVTTGARIEREIVLRGGRSHTLAVSANGKWAASAGHVGDVFVVNLATGKAHEVMVAEQEVKAVHLSPDGSTLFVASDHISRWHVASKQRTGLQTGSAPIAMSSDGTQFAFCHDNGTVGMWSQGDNKTLRQLRVPDPRQSISLTFSPSGEQLAVAKSEQKNYLLNVASGNVDDTSNNANLWRSPEDTNKDRRNKVVDALGRDEPRATIPGTKGHVRFTNESLVVHDGNGKVTSIDVPHRLTGRYPMFTGDGRHLAFTNYWQLAPIQVARVADGRQLQLPAHLNRQLPVAFPGGKELALWQRPSWQGENVNQAPKLIPKRDGTLTYVCLDALAAGQACTVRSSQFRVAFASHAPVFARNSNLVAIDHTVRDAVTPQRVAWSLPENEWESILDLSSDFAIRCSTILIASGSMPFVITALRKDGTQLAQREFLYDGRAFPHRGSLSPTAEQFAQMASSKLHVLTAPELEPVCTLSGDWDHCQWIDNERLLLADHEGQLSIFDVATKRTTLLDLPILPIHGLAVAPNGSCAAISHSASVAVVRLPKPQ